MNPFRLLWNGVTRTGRILLWLLFWPIGLWRSLAHGRKRDRKRLEEQIKDLQRQQGASR